MSPEFKLDIGIGKGGRYINNDEKQAVRIGFDIDDTALRLLRYESEIPLVRGDADVQRHQFSLPFATEAFQSVEVLFPHDELLCALTSGRSLLWGELHRVLKLGGSVSITLDVPYIKMQGTYYHGAPTLIHNPHLLIHECAEDNGLRQIQMSELPEEEVRQLGTDFSNFAANAMEDFFPSKAYKITCIKEDH